MGEEAVEDIKVTQYFFSLQLGLIYRAAFLSSFSLNNFFNYSQFVLLFNKIYST